MHVHSLISKMHYYSIFNISEIGMQLMTMCILSAEFLTHVYPHQ